MSYIIIYDIIQYDKCSLKLSNSVKIAEKQSRLQPKKLCYLKVTELKVKVQGKCSQMCMRVFSFMELFVIIKITKRINSLAVFVLY